MAIGIDASRAFGAQPTGIGVYATEVLSGLIADPPAPLSLYLNAAAPPFSAPPLPEGSRWVPIPLPRGWTRLRLALEVRRHPPELLFVPAYRLPPGRIPRSVVTIHGVEHRMAPAAYPGRAAAAVEDFVEDTLRRAARIISPSETTRADLAHLYGADPARITVIPHGIAAELGPVPEADALAERRRLGVIGPYFLAVGAHHPRKNIPFLVRAFGLAFPDHPGAPRLVVANAAGSAAAELSAEARGAGLTGRLLLLPHLGARSLAALYVGALAATVPSLYEGFGLPALEAMACGAPLVASGVGGVQEVAAGAALLVEPSNLDEWVGALRQLAEDQGLRSHLSELGRNRAAGFSWKRSVEGHRRLLADELSAAQRR